MRASLLRDLRGEGIVLLDPNAQLPDSREPEELLRETQSVRAYRPARPLAPEHVIVEPKQAIPSLLEADASTVSDLLKMLTEIAREIQQRRGRCRIWTDVGPEEPKFRWHIAAPRE